MIAQVGLLVLRTWLETTAAQMFGSRLQWSAVHLQTAQSKHGTFTRYTTSLSSKEKSSDYSVQEDSYVIVKCMRNNVSTYARGLVREVTQITGLEKLRHDVKTSSLARTHSQSTNNALSNESQNSSVFLVRTLS